MKHALGVAANLYCGPRVKEIMLAINFMDAQTIQDVDIPKISNATYECSLRTLLRTPEKVTLQTSFFQWLEETTFVRTPDGVPISP